MYDNASIYFYEQIRGVFALFTNFLFRDLFNHKSYL